MNDLDDSMTDQEYDLISRHILAVRILKHLRAGGRVLDIGGADGLTGSYLGNGHVISIDILSNGVDVIGSAAGLPFANHAFTAALALDVLEHVDDQVKAVLISEAARVADVVVLGGPYDNLEVRKTEDHQRHLFAALFGRDHPWLCEHASAGLPSLAETQGRLAEYGFTTIALGSNPLMLWAEQLYNSHVALRVGLDEKTVPVRRWLVREFLERADATPPSYRYFVVGSRTSRDLESVRAIWPKAERRLVDEAVRRVQASTASVVEHGVATLEELRGAAQRGWAESVKTIHQQEEAIRAIEASATAFADGWAESVARVHELESMFWKAPDERSIKALEYLVLNETTWRSLVAGPPVQEPLLWNLMPDPGAYRTWLERRPEVDVPPAGPLFSVVVPVFDPPAEYLTECIRSIRKQTYSAFELILVDVSTAPHVMPILARFEELDDRIVVIRHENRGIAGNTNVGVKQSTGAWAVFVDHDDLLEPHALASIARRLAEEPSADLIYSDEDKIDASGDYVEPFFKPDWSPELLYTVNYIAHLTACRRTLFDKIDGFREGFEGAQDYDFLLRATSVADRIEHVADVLYHWRQHGGSTALDVRSKPEAHSAGRRALSDLLRRSGSDAWVEVGVGATTHRVRHQRRSGLVSIIVPFRDAATLTETCLKAIDRSTRDVEFEVLLVSNQSSDSETFAAMDRWKAHWEWLRVIEDNESFNFQRINNQAVGLARGSLLLFLNNDTEPLHPDWLHPMVELAQQPEIGAVGARLFFEDGAVQHAGVAVGIGGFAEHPWARLHPDAITPAGPSYWVRNVLAVTAACLMVDKEKFEGVGGFDERFIVCGGDVDLCLRLHEKGLRNVMTPYTRVLHREGSTRERKPPENDVRESLRAYARYLALGDPFYNRNLTLIDTTCQLAGAEPRI